MILPQHGHGDASNSPSAPSASSTRPHVAPKLRGENEAWPKTVTVVGLGLLGASLCEAAKRRHPGVTVFGISSAATVSQALAEGVIDEGGSYEQLDAFAARADLTVLCTPIDHILGVLERWRVILPAFKSGAIVTDVGSTKAAICEAARAAFAKSNLAASFIGSHPMAGSEKSGLSARDSHLFENACWIVCPDEGQPSEPCERLAFFLESLGARLVQLDPKVHDATVAHVSHLPQLLATALAAFVSQKNPIAENGLQVAGGGFRDMTRLAASRFEMWDPILRTNKQEVMQALLGYQSLLGQMAAALSRDEMSELFAAGQSLRARLQTHRKGLTHALSDILVDLEDKPGALLAVLQPLAQSDLNVLDCEILKVREGEGGVLLLAFANEATANLALTQLHQAGFKARHR
jgi:prephenate dehydrogenase